MGLGLTSGGGDFLPFIKYDAKAGRFFRRDSTETATGWDRDDIDITDGCAFIMDLKQIQVGWADFSAGTPSRIMVPLGDPLPERPSDKHKQGFQVLVKLSKGCAGDQPPVRELSSSAGVTISAIDALHDAYKKAPEAQNGQLPVVQMTGVEGIKSQHGTNYKPLLAITGWVDRPADMPLGAAPTPAAAPAAKPDHTPPPAQPAAPPAQPAAAGGPEF